VVVAGERFGRTLQVSQHAAAVVEGLDVVRLDRQCLVVAGERLGKEREISKRIAAIVEEIGSRGLIASALS